MQKILMLAAIPDRLRLDQEIRSIEEAIKRGVKRDSFEIKIRTAVRPQDIRRAIAEERPEIVHFCGHGREDGSLVLEDDGGNHKPVPPQGLAALFELHTDYVKCVLLNACYSIKPAEAISQHINYVIGMNQAIGDNAAIVFAVGFYDGLGYDNPKIQDVIPRAFNEGVVAIQLEHLSSGKIPVIKTKTKDRPYKPVTEKKPNIPGSLPEPDNPEPKIKKVSYFSRVTIVFGIVVLTSIGWTYYNYTSSVCMKYKVPNGIYLYAGSTTWALFREKVERSIQNDCPNFTLKFRQHPRGTNASTFGIKKLLQSQVDFSISSRNLQPEEEKSKLKQIPVAIDATAIVVNYDLNLPKSGLTIDKLRSIYTGRITNWNQLGVPENLQISIYEVRNSSYSFLVKQEVLDGKDSAYKSIPVSSITKGVQKVKENKGGIYISSAAHLISQCSVRPLPLGQQENQLVPPYQLPFIPSNECTTYHKNQPNTLAFINGKYPLTNRLFVMIKQDDQHSQESGQAFANLLRSSKYQEIIKESGFVKISE